MKIWSLILFSTFAQIGWSQTDSKTFPMYNDSVKMDKYMLLTNERLNSIRNKVHQEKDLIRIDTLDLEVQFSIQNSVGEFILQNPYSTKPILNIDTDKSIQKAFITFLDNELVSIVLFTGLNTCYLYFDHNVLVKSVHSCQNPNDFIGYCGGTQSAYTNYFKESNYYSTIIDGKRSYCGCGSNFIVPKEIIHLWIKEIKKME